MKPIPTTYAGLDVSLDETHICIVDERGGCLTETRVPTDPEAVHNALQTAPGKLRRIGLEASSLSLWLQSELSAAGHPAIIIEARHANATMQAQRNKTDRNDARALAQIMRTGWFRSVHTKSDDSRRMRMLLGNRRLLKRKLIDMENHIRGTLRPFGLLVGPVSRGKFDARVRELIDDVPADMTAFIETLLIVRHRLLEGYAELHRLVLGFVRTDLICRRFMLVPGVGPIAALSFRAAIDDPHRFRRTWDIAAYLGLTPRRWQSGSIDRTGSISKHGDREVRTALCEAAAGLLLRTRKWTAIKAWGLRLAKRTSMLNAITAVARKYAVILLRMWRDAADFKPGLGAKVTEKMRLSAPATA